MTRRNYINVDVVNDFPIRKYGRNKKYQTSKYKILKNGAYFSTMIGTKTRKWLIRWRLFALYVVNIYVTSSWLCRFPFTVFYQRRIVGGLKLSLIWFGQKFRWVMRDIISWIIQKIRKFTRPYQVFEVLWFQFW